MSSSSFTTNQNNNNDDLNKQFIQLQKAFKRSLTDGDKSASGELPERREELVVNLYGADVKNTVVPKYNET